MQVRPQEAFLSHSNIDGAYATDLATVLRTHGIPIWYSPTDIIGAQQWHDEIGAALKRCDWFLLTLSRSSVESVWVKRELFFALNDQRYVDRIVPLLFEPCDYASLSWTLPALQLIDFTQSVEIGYRELLRISTDA
jgi:hypothetical protein